MNELARPLFVPPSAHTGAGAGACGWAGMPGAAARSFRPGLSISLFPKQRAVPLWHLKLEKQRKGGEASTALPKPHRLPKRNFLGLWHPSMSGHKLPLSSTLQQYLENQRAGFLFSFTHLFFFSCPVSLTSCYTSLFLS